LKEGKNDRLAQRFTYEQENTNVRHKGNLKKTRLSSFPGGIEGKEISGQKSTSHAHQDYLRDQLSTSWERSQQLGRGKKRDFKGNWGKRVAGEGRPKDF